MDRSGEIEYFKVITYVGKSYSNFFNAGGFEDVPFYDFFLPSFTINGF